MCRNLSYFLSAVVVLLGITGNTLSLTEPNPGAADKKKPVTLDTDPNLVGWWRFDEVSGKTAADSSLYGRKG
ncbi:MAG: hypothetical protein NTX52_10545, partial [Planctomycetota bacterium]|nr:hypothetical protein [Planctomycetota bacterium]